MRTVMVYGKRKTGKTAFALSSPKPLVYFDFELGIEDIEPRFLPDMSQVTVHNMVEEIALQDKKDKEAVKKFWHDILKNYNAALEDDNVETVVFDTFTSVWAACRTAYLAELKERDPNRQAMMPQDYGEPNRRMKMLITQSRLHNKTLVLVHHIKEVYDEKGTATGELTFDGFKYTGDLVDIVLNFSKKDKKPLLTVEDCRLTMAAEGLNPPASFQGAHDFIERLRNL